MPVPYTVSISDLAGGIVDTIRGEFPDDDHALIVDFVSFADDLSRVACVHNNGIESFRFTVGDAEMTVSTPPVAELDQLLLAMRPFILQNERTHVPRMLNVIRRAIADRSVRAHLDGYETLFIDEGRRDRPRFWISKQMPAVSVDPAAAFAGCVALDGDHVLHLWLNGYKYHRDQSKRSAFEGLCGAISSEFVGRVLAPNLARKVLAIRQLADFLRPIAMKRPASQSTATGVDTSLTASSSDGKSTP